MKQAVDLQFGQKKSPKRKHRKAEKEKGREKPNCVTDGFR